MLKKQGGLAEKNKTPWGANRLGQQRVSSILFIFIFLFSLGETPALAYGRHAGGGGGWPCGNWIVKKFQCGEKQIDNVKEKNARRDKFCDHVVEQAQEQAGGGGQSQGAHHFRGTPEQIKEWAQDCGKYHSFVEYQPVYCKIYEEKCAPAPPPGSGTGDNSGNGSGSTAEGDAKPTEGNPTDVAGADPSQSGQVDAGKNKQGNSASEMERDSNALSRGSQDANQMSQDAMGGVQNYMDQWKQNLSTITGEDDYPEELQAYQNDSNLVQQARSAVGGKGNFTQAQANSAQDQYVREGLNSVVLTKTVGQGMAGDSRDMAMGAAAARRLEKTSGERLDNLGAKGPAELYSFQPKESTGPKGDFYVEDSTLSSGNGTQKVKKISLKEGGKVDVVKSKSDLAVNGKSDGAGGSGSGKKEGGDKAAKASGLAIATDADAPSGAPGKGNRSHIDALRDNLRKQMAGGKGVGADGKPAKGADKDALDETHFEKSLSPTMLGEVSRDGRLLSESGSAPSGAGGFSLGSGDASSELNKLVGEGRGLASDQWNGLLGIESKSLFDRVRHAHRSCLEKHCL